MFSCKYLWRFIKLSLLLVFFFYKIGKLFATNLQENVYRKQWPKEEFPKTVANFIPTYKSKH